MSGTGTHGNMDGMGNTTHPGTQGGANGQPMTGGGMSGGGMNGNSSSMCEADGNASIPCIPTPRFRDRRAANLNTTAWAGIATVGGTARYRRWKVNRGK